MLANAIKPRLDSRQGEKTLMHVYYTAERDGLAERVTELEQQARKHEATTTRRLDDLENVIRYLAEDASRKRDAN